jgi:hypothetical protein
MNNPGATTAQIATHLAHTPLAQLPGLTPSGQISTDFTHAAYLVFSGLLVTGAAITLTYGRKALTAVGKRFGARASRLASGVADKLYDDMEKRLGINEYSDEGRRRFTTELVNNWILHGKDDACIAGGIRSLQLLDEPMNSRQVLENQFNIKSLVRESTQTRRPVFDRALDFYDSLTALLLGSDILPSDREKMLAALALHLPEPGCEIRRECAALIETLQGINTSLPAGIRLLANSDPDKIATMKDRPGIKVLSHTSWPLSQAYKIQEEVLISRGTKREPFIISDGRPDGKLRVGFNVVPTPNTEEVAAHDLASATPVSPAASPDPTP